MSPRLSCIRPSRSRVSFSRMRNTQLGLLLSLVSFGLVSGHAQSPANGADQVAVRFSQSSRHDITLGGAAAGELAVNATSLSWRSALAVSQNTRLNYGLSWEHFAFSRPAVSAVPDTLQEIAAVLGASHRLSPQWLLLGTIHPGLYGDLEGSDGDAFNAPVMLVATWLRSPTLAWTFGLRVDGFADRPVIPFVGVNWKFSPDWEFSLGLPRSGLSYTVSPTLELGLGVSVQGGNFHVARDPRPVAIGSRLDDTKLDYHEIRVGFAADWKLNGSLTLMAEAGVITDQKFDYFDRNHAIDGDRTAYFSVGLSGRF